MQRAQVGNSDLTVGLVHWALPPTIGGVESHLADYIGLLAARRIRVVVFTGELRPSLPAHDRVVYAYHRALHLVGRGTLPEDGPETTAELRHWLREKFTEHGVNIVHGHNLHYFSSAPATALNDVCTELGIARHHTYHNFWGGNWHYAHLVASWEGRWSNSEYVAGLCKTGYEGDPPHTQYMGIDTDRFDSRRTPFEGRDARSAVPERAPVILQPARLLRWKGPIESVQMLHRLHREGYRARLILTDTPALIDWDDEAKALRAELNDLIKEYDLCDWVTFRENAHYGDMPALYNEADIVINPSHGEPLGLVALEAMAAARPVVATDSGGMTETIVQRAGEVIVDDGNLAQSLAASVRKFLENPGEAVAAGALGRRHVERNFPMNAYVDTILSAYRESLDRLRAA